MSSRHFAKSVRSLSKYQAFCVDTCVRFSEAFFVDASSEDTIAEDLKNIALVKGKGDSHEDTLDWLSDTREEWLLFFNNADDRTINLQEYFPNCYHGNIIITTRNPETSSYASKPEAFCRITSLATNDARELLIKIAHVSDGHTDESQKLAMDLVKVSDIDHVSYCPIFNILTESWIPPSCYCPSWSIHPEIQTWSFPLPRDVHATSCWHPRRVPEPGAESR
jgi:hypothetical protein